MILKENISRLSILIAVLLMLYSSGPWFFWNAIFVSIVLKILFILCRLWLCEGLLRKYSISILLLFLLYFWMELYHWNGLMKSIGMLFYKFIPLLLITMMKYDEKRRLVDTVLTVFSLIILVSIGAYFLYLFGIPLKSSIIEHSNTFYPPFTNYYFFVKVNSLSEFMRFSSVFTEPGHLGMISALLLYVNHYNFSDYRNVVFLIAIILSLSLAAYILLLLGWFLCYILSKKMSIALFAKIVIVLLFVVLLVQVILYYSPSGAFNELIIQRMQYDSELGIEGNNRNDQFFMNFYNNFISTKDYFLGIGEEKVGSLFANTANSSYRVYILQYGVLGFIILILYFYSYIYGSCSKLAFGLFALFFVSFLQRPYWFSWELQSYVYICVIPLLDSKICVDKYCSYGCR